MGFGCGLRDECTRGGGRRQWIGVRIGVVEGGRWEGRKLEQAESLTKNNKVLTLNMCINYGGRAEILDAAVAIAKDAMRKKIKPDALTEKSITKYLYAPLMSDVDLFIRSSGEQRTSNFLMWQSAYAEMVFLDVLWPDADRRTLWKAIEIYAERERRFGKA